MAATLKVDTIVHPTGTPNNLTLDNAGNVTIGNNLTVTGTTTLTTPLSVSQGGTGLTSLTTGLIPYGNGTGAFSSNSVFNYNGTNLTVGSGGPSVGILVGVVDSGIYYDVSGAFDVRGRTGYPLTISALGSTYTAFNTNGSERMRIASDGNVGIGTTSTTSYKLSTQGAPVRFFTTSSGPFNFDSGASMLVSSGDGGANNTYLRVTGGVYTQTNTTNLDLFTAGNNFSQPLGFRISAVTDSASASAGRTLKISAVSTDSGGAIGTITDRLVIDNSGNVTVGGTVVMGSSFKRNRIINGDMRVAQRGTSFSTPSNAAYTLDRWFVTWGGAAPATVAQVTGPTGFKNAIQITGAASNTSVSLYQRIESQNCSDLSGLTVTIQANIAVSSSQTVAWQLGYANAADNFSSATSISSGTWSATSTATTFTATVTSLPSGATNGLQLIIQPNNGGAFTSGTITITGVQLEVGSVATPYERQIYSDQLAQCQRYYYKKTASAIGTNLGFGFCDSTTSAFIINDYQVAMRTSPTALEQTGTASDYSVRITGSGVVVCSSVPIFGACTLFASIALFTVTSGLTAGQGCTIRAATANAYLAWSAEL